MKKLILSFIKLVLLCLCLFSQASFAQYGWQIPANNGLYAPYYRFEDVYFTDTVTGYAVSSNGSISKTVDGGINWTYYQDGNAQLRSIEFLSDGLTGIAGSLNGFTLRTTDSGNTWNYVNTVIDTFTGDAGARSMCGLAHFGNTFYGVGWWGSKKARFYKSTDKGVTWQTTYIDTNLATNLVDVVFLSKYIGFATGGRNTTDSSSNIICNESVVLKTTDGGTTWTKVFSDTTIGGRIWKIQFIDGQNAVGAIEPYYYPDTVNMIRSVDGGNSWTIIHAGRHNTATLPNYGFNQGVGFATLQKGWMGGYYTGIFETNNGGLTWDTLAFGANLNRFFVIDSNHIFAGGQTIYKWTQAIQPPSNIYTNALKPPHDLYPISPNPSTGKVKIEFDIKSETNTVLEVANVDIRRHYNIVNKRLKPGHYIYWWDGTNAPAGNYIVWLGTDEIPITQKFVLVK